MTNERTKALAQLGREIATQLNAVINPLDLGWKFIEPLEDTWSVYLQQAKSGARIYLSFAGYGDDQKRVEVSGWMHIGKGNTHVTVYERGGKVSPPSITVAFSRGPAAIAKDIAKRFLPEYLHVFALAQARVAEDAAYESRIAVNLQRLALTANITIPAKSAYQNEVRREVSGTVGHTRVSIHAYDTNRAQLVLDLLTLEQAEHIINFLKRK